MIKVYHSRRARSARVIWLLEELGVPYELVAVEFKRESLKSPEYLRLHPLGLVPVVQDGDVTLFESGAIVEYLLEQYGQGRLAPAPGTKARAEYFQWFHFGEATLARHMGDIVQNRFIKPEAERSPEMAAEARGRLLASLGVIERALEGHAYILGEAFTAADIMVAYGIIMTKIIGELPADLPHVAGYLGRLKERPAYQPAWA